MRSSPHLEHRVPRACAQCVPIHADAQAADAVVVAGENSHLLTRERIPHIAVEVVVAGEEEAAGERVRYGGDAAQDLVVRVLHQLRIRSQVVESTRRVVGAGGEGMTAGEEVHRVDVALVPYEGQLAPAAVARVPYLRGRVTRARDESIPVVGRDGEAHHVAVVLSHLRAVGAGLGVPQHARHVARRRQDRAVAHEAAAREVARMRHELARHLGAAGGLLRVEVVDRADVVEATARHLPPARREAARHHPGRAQSDHVQLVGRESVPHDELAVLRGAHQVSLGGLPLRPVHRVDLRKVALEHATVLHLKLRQRRHGLLLKSAIGCRITLALDLGLKLRDLRLPHRSGHR
mmetsp:Transcript_31208/g.79712  ORF Transcript_31208/g.79712 Transcript_31208/m.79712 type:complete len:349 (+) Transcript_31208:315-1361(+)